MANYSYTIPEGEHKGATLWSGRYCCVVATVILVGQNQELRILVNKRGPRTPNYQGKWNLPCGFLEDDESGEQGIAREVFEETGIKIDPSIITLEGVTTDPETDKHVTLRYAAILSLEELEGAPFPYQLVTVEDVTPPEELAAAEAGEVEAVKWIGKTNYKELDWAFNHEALLDKFFEE